MIELTRLNNHPFLLNSDLIKWIENTPDTVLTLVSGEKVLVSESSSQVLQRIIDFRRRIFPGWNFDRSPSPEQVCRQSEPPLPGSQDS